MGSNDSKLHLPVDCHFICRWVSVEFPIAYRNQRKLSRIVYVTVAYWIFVIVLCTLAIVYAVEDPSKCPWFEMASETTDQVAVYTLFSFFFLLALCYIRFAVLVLKQRKKIQAQSQNPGTTQESNATKWRIKMTTMMGKVSKCQSTCGSAVGFQFYQLKKKQAQENYPFLPILKFYSFCRYSSCRVHCSVLSLGFEHYSSHSRRQCALPDIQDRQIPVRFQPSHQPNNLLHQGSENA